MKKCQFINICKYYDPKSNTCNKNAGSYYSPYKKAGCFKRLQEIENLRSDIRFLHRKNIKGIYNGSIKHFEDILQKLTDEA